tara:strand:- start:1589 stop:2254 length:666 start_codon:yes stop_codon:yes gene_type:complete
MITVNVNETKWRIPERFTISEWIAIQKWDVTNESHWCYVINEISGIPVEEFIDAEQDSMQLFMGFVISAVNKRTLKHHIDFNKLNFGQFVDLDCFMALGVEKHIDQILAVLEVDTPWADEALAVIEQYIKWRNTIYKQYKSLFGLEDRDFLEQEPSDDVYDPREVSRGWYQVIVDLAGEDILKMDVVTEEPLQKVLTFLQIKKEKALASANEARKIRNKQR